MTGVAATSDSHPLWALKKIADRALVPLAPIFVALQSSWTAQIAPAGVLKSVLLMAFFGPRDDVRLCDEVADNSAFRRFLSIDDAQHFDVVALSQGLDRLVSNELARQFVRDVVTAARGSGLTADGRVAMDEPFLESWTSRRPKVMTTA